MTAATAADAPLSSLTLDEAVPLAHALVDKLASNEGIRVLFIKGPILAQQGLRPPRTSVDVDVLVEPTRFVDLRAALEDIGWVDQGPYSGAFILPLHSATYKHPLWPCEIDVHDRFPGFFAYPAVVFEALWGRRTTGRLAGRNLPCCDVIGNAAIAALHWLRDPQYDESQARLAHMAQVLRDRLDENGRNALGELAKVTGAADTLSPLLDAVDAPNPGAGRTPQEDLRDWRLRTSGVGVVCWLVELCRAPVRRRLPTLWRALLLSEREIRRIQGGSGPGRYRMLIAGACLLSRGLCAVPRALLVLARARRMEPML